MIPFRMTPSFRGIDVANGARIAALAAALAGASIACSKADRAQANAHADTARQINVESVRQDPVRRAVEVVGTLVAESEVTISAEAEGRVGRLLADLGDRVKAGQA